MELLLNIVWLLIVGSALYWQARSASTDRKQFLLAFGALCCALLLLFPTVSISDDLHFEAVLSEDSSPTKRMAAIVTHVVAVHQLAVFFSVFASLMAALHATEWCVRNTNPVQYLSALLDRPVLGRAPPVLFLV